MKILVVVLVVLALPQVLGLSTLCNAGPSSSCEINFSTGGCLRNGDPCGTWSKQTHCATIPGPSPLFGAKRPGPQGTTCVCQ